jgi:hypothetical protein
MSYLNQNGLEDGNIPKGKACPFLQECGLRNDRCPTQENPKPVNYSCAGARLFSLVREKP